MSDTRRRIVDLLRVRGSQSVEDLVAALGVTRTAVVSHLSALQADGVAARRGLRAGRRRPSVVYELTEAADRLYGERGSAYQNQGLALARYFRDPAATAR